MEHKEVIKEQMPVRKLGGLSADIKASNRWVAHVSLFIFSWNIYVRGQTLNNLNFLLALLENRN